MMLYPVPFFALLAVAKAQSCFPFAGSLVSTPSVLRSQWWCPQSDMYGFMGFSYPLEVPDCSDVSNGYDQINKDFAKMKSDFGAIMVRVYAPECREASVWENLLKAGINNNMGVIPQVWWGFGDQNLWKQTQASIYSIMEGQYKAIAPYVFHSAEFGSEPIGDGVDGGNFISDLAAFRTKMKGYGIPVAISEDWDRPGTMSSSNGNGLGSTGLQVKANSDMVHGHAMPFYHNKNEAEAWPYVASQVQWYSENVGLPALISESQWAWGTGGDHGSGVGDVGTAQYSAYWHSFDDNCDLFKQYQTGWFIHAWAMESTFDMVKDDGSYVIPAWKPKRCGGGNTTSSPTQSFPTAAADSSASIPTTLQTATPTAVEAQTAGTTTSSSGSTSGSGGSCSWPGHCQGASCKTYNDCADPYSCTDGKCT